MAKKNKKKDDLPEGMSRRQAKLAARAAERAALESEPRPYGGLALEADLVALQEFVPSAVAKLPVKGSDREVYLATVLPGGGAALVREEDSVAYVALQTQVRSSQPGRDLAAALAWAISAEPGSNIAAIRAEENTPALSDLIEADTTLEITEHQDFNWWLPEGRQIDAMTQQALQTANDAVVESHQVQVDSAKVPGALWWVNPGGGKAHIRWVRPDSDEDALLSALARVAAAGELHLGEGTKFAGAFRTHGLIVPVFDLDPAVPFDSYDAEISRVAAAIDAQLSNQEQLSADERKQLQNIKSRQVTIR